MADVEVAATDTNAETATEEQAEAHRHRDDHASIHAPGRGHVAAARDVPDVSESIFFMTNEA